MQRFFLTALLFLPSVIQAQMPVSADTRTAVAHIIGDVMVNGQAYDYDRHLADEIGPRLTGSENYARAASWAESEFKRLGLSNVHTEPFTLKAAWEPDGPASGHIVAPREQALHIYSLGWSPSTPDHGVKGEVAYLKHLSVGGVEEQKSELADKIILIDHDSLGESPAFSQILQALDRMSKLSPKAVLLVGGANGSQNATALSFDGSIFPYPTGQIGSEDTSLIRRLLEHGPVTVEFSYKNRIRKNVEVNNVVAEIPGRERANEVVIIAGHLDSWHPATGAQDNGTGAATVIEAARAIKASGRAPRRTIRFILFGGEEQGILGSTAYVRAHRNDLPSIDCVLISDTGGERAKGWYLMGRDDEKDALKNVEPLLTGLGSDSTTGSVEFLFQTDHISFDLLGVPTLVLWTDTEKYFKLHHKASDSFDAVNQADLNQGAATTIATAFAIADSDQAFAPHQTPAEVEEWLKREKQWDDYQFFKNVGVFP